jgi:hypothetical protein
MMVWIIGIIIYLLIGLGLLIGVVLSDPWGGLVLEMWWMVIFFYPILIVWSIYQNMK